MLGECEASSMHGSAFVEPSPSRFRPRRLKVRAGAIPTRFQAGPGRGENRHFASALSPKKSRYRLPAFTSAHAPGVWSCIACPALLGNRVGSRVPRLVGPVVSDGATPPDDATGMPVAASRRIRAHEDGVSRNLDFCRKKRKQRASPRSVAARSIRLVE